MLPRGWFLDPASGQLKRVHEHEREVQKDMAAHANDMESFMEDDSSPSSGVAGQGRSNSQDDDGVAASSGKAKRESSIRLCMPRADYRRNSQKV